MTCSVKEMYYTLQGEGAHTGRAACELRARGLAEAGIADPLLEAS